MGRINETSGGRENGRGGRMGVRRLLAAAGRAVGRSEASERGTVLLMVIGVLAMMSIVALVYASIGQADRRSAAAVAREARLDDQADAIAEYLSGIVALDLFSTFTDPASGREYREATDYPSTSPAARSFSTDPDELFDPAGGIISRATGGTDPWLASTEPAYIPFPTRTEPAPTPADEDYLRRVDWPQISNLSPNGRFVNLWALRNNFRAQPGIDDDLDGKPQMSKFLTLFDLNTGQPQPRGPQTLPDGTPAILNVPAHWSTNQVWMHRPAFDLTTVVRPETSPGKEYWIPYQYADADGDGMIDSRWFEPVSFENPGNPVVDYFLPGVRLSGPARLFVAARVIDLSGLVNVNTAMDFRSEPMRDFPVGVLPAEIDLRRLLQLTDAYENIGVAYDMYEPERRPQMDQDYSYEDQYDIVAAAGIGEAAFVAMEAYRQDGWVPVGALTAAPGTVRNAQRRAQYYRDFGFEHAQGRRLATTAETQFSRRFGIGDESELRTFHGANDPSTLSNFESVIAGRAPTYPEFCVLRSTRPLTVERFGRGNRFPPVPGGHEHGTPQNGLPDNDALLQSATDIRRLLTFHSAARQLRSVEITNTNRRGILGPEELRLDMVDILDRASATPTDAAAVRTLFGAYAHALLPHILPPQGSGPTLADLWDDREYMTLAYGGRGPELALRFAAQMTANMIDLYDSAAPPGTNGVTALVVPFRQGAGITVPPGMIEVNLDTTPIPGHGNPLPQRLDPTPPPFGASGAYVYGTEAQPFLTEVATFHMFTDMPTGGGGDQDWIWRDINGDGNVTQDELSRDITLKGDVSSTNADFLMQVVAFQIHNPFTDQINNLDQYYFQLGQTIFKIPTGTNNVLAPGETRVYFCTNPGRDAIDARWAPAFVQAPTGTADQWLETHLGIPAGTLGSQELTPYDLTNVAVPTGTVRDFFIGSPTGPAEPRNRVALLWREFGTIGDTSDDILADRLRDPADLAGQPTWDRRFKLTDETVGGDSLAGPERASGTDQFANTGVSITLYGTARRPADPSGGATPVIPRGAIPAFCIERKDGPLDSLNIGKTDSVANPNNLSMTDFVANHGASTFDAMISAQLTTSFPDVRIDKKPELNNTAGEILAATEHPLGIPYDRLYPEIHLNNKRFRAGSLPITPDRLSVMRLGDLLLPMAVGTERLIGLPPADPITDLENQWTTLAESLAIGVGYGNEPKNGGGAAATDYHLGLDVLDRGHLRLDTFVPFRKNSPPADFATPWLFDPAVDTAYYPAIPMALNILNQFRPQHFDTGYDSERTPVAGLININTAPLNVLRTLPLLTPLRGGTWVTDTTINGARRTAGGPSLYGALTPVPLMDPSSNFLYDIAAMVAAYRDKAQIWTRPDPTGTPGVGARLLDFSQDPTAPNFTARTDKTQIFGIREDAGFSSIGELLAVMQRDVDANNRPHFVSTNADLDNSINRFGFAATVPTDWAGETTTGITGLDSTVYPGGVDGFPDEIINDYDEQLTIANAVLGSITTRSDVFCVWFVVHGYLPSDVEGLDDNEPMIPSIARRYVMIVDRSNVTTKGEKPRILLLREVPL